MIEHYWKGDKMHVIVNERVDSLPSYIKRVIKERFVHSSVTVRGCRWKCECCGNVSDAEVLDNNKLQYCKKKYNKYTVKYIIDNKKAICGNCLRKQYSGEYIIVDNIMKKSVFKQFYNECTDFTNRYENFFVQFKKRISPELIRKVTPVEGEQLFAMPVNARKEIFNAEIEKYINNTWPLWLSYITKECRKSFEQIKLENEVLDYVKNCKKTFYKIIAETSYNPNYENTKSIFNKMRSLDYIKPCKNNGEEKDLYEPLKIKPLMYKKVDYKKEIEKMIKKTEEIPKGLITKKEIMYVVQKYLKKYLRSREYNK